MSINKLASAAAVAALFALPLAAHAQQSASTLVKDSAITAKIKAAQASDSTVRATRINVETDNAGVVTLSGNARSQAEIDRAVELAKGVQGVTSVTNNMTVVAGAAGTTATTPSTSSSTTPSTSTSNSNPNSSSTSTGSMATTDTSPMTTARAPRTDRN